MTILEITATFLGVTRHFENADSIGIIADCSHVSGDKPAGVNCRMVIKGSVDSLESLHQHQTYRFYGRWTEYQPKKPGSKPEPQFHFQTFVQSVPQTKAGIVAYLAKNGEGHGIGRQRAITLFEKFAGDAVRVCREMPEIAAAAVPGWHVDQAADLAKLLNLRKQTEECTIELIGLLDRRGFPKATAQAAITRMGNIAKNAIANDPYKLMQFRGCGFKRCDKLYIDLGLPPGRLKRQALCAWYAVASNRFGHTWMPIEMATDALARNISSCDLRVEDALKLAKRADLLSFKTSPGGKLFVSEAKKARNEKRISEEIARCLFDSGEVLWPDVSTISGVSDHQREKLADATTGMIGILGGGPGTGKTYTSTALILALLQKYGADKIAVVAPTGKAAVRISEVMAENNIEIRAKTIHSFLKVEQSEGGWSFHFCAGRPVSAKFVIVDEVSMVDVDLMASLLSARGEETHILFVGDVNQLPPVNHGAPLRDFIAAGLPYGELSEIRRNSGEIVRLCAAIRECQPLEIPTDQLEINTSRNLRIISTASPDNQKQMMMEAISWAAGQNFNPIWDVQVIAAVNNKSPLSRNVLNKLLQVELNSQEPSIHGTPFRAGDKIVNSKNGFFGPMPGQTIPATVATNSAGDIYVANGDVGRVVSVEPKSLVVELQIAKILIRVPRGTVTGEAKPAEADGDIFEDSEETATNTGCDWDLAYCLSCHKSQGSEYPVAVVILDEYPGAMMIASKEWIYTAISRGKKATILIGKSSTVDAMRRKVALGQRKTFLRDMILELQANSLVEAML